MPADIRLSTLTFDPNPPVAEDPFTVYAQCLNVGNEGTGPFVARFQLDARESIDIKVDNIAPNESTWASWPHAAIAVGDHSVYCMLDAGHAVPESEERFNQQTVYFKVAKRSQPPSDAHGTEYYDDNALAEAVISQLGARVNHWMILVVQAVEEWESETRQRIDQWDFNGDVQVDFMGVFGAFAQAVLSRAPGASQAMSVIKDLGDIYNAIRAYNGTTPITEATAKARLRASAQDLKSGAGAALRTATDGYATRLTQWLSPSNDHSPLAHVEKGSTDPAYIASLCDWLGFPEANTQNTTTPIKKELTDSFDHEFDRVAKEMWKASGYN
jgi:hypothetical protein